MASHGFVVLYLSDVVFFFFFRDAWNRFFLEQAIPLSKNKAMKVVILSDFEGLIKRWLFYAISILFPKERAIWYSNMTRPWCPGAFTTIPAIRLGFPDVGPKGWTQQGRGERDTFRLRIINSDNDSFLLRVVLDFGRRKQHNSSYQRLGFESALLRFWTFWTFWMWKNTNTFPETVPTPTRPRFPDSGGNAGNAFALSRGHQKPVTGQEKDVRLGIGKECWGQDESI